MKRLVFFFWLLLWGGVLAGSAGASGYFPAGEADGYPADFNWHLERLEAPLAHNFACGQDVVVAQIDSGVNLLHPDLQGHIVTELAYDFGENDTDVTDLLGHGTATAGLILQVAPCARILPLKINVGPENYFENQTVREALAYLLELLPSHPEIKILNMSIVMSPDEEVADLLRAISARGVTIVAPTGNDNRREISFPASLAEVVAVGGTDQNDQRYWQANVGPGIFVVAPAERIWAPLDGQGYMVYSGTSLSAAMVSGVLALLAEKGASRPALAVAEGAQDFGEPGYDQENGFGRVSALEALVAFHTRHQVIFPKKLSLGVGESGFLFFFPSGPREVILTAPEVAEITLEAPERGLIEFKARKPGQTKIVLAGEGGVLTAWLEVAETPQPMAEILIFPRVSVAGKEATMCLYISRGIQSQGPFYLGLASGTGPYLFTKETFGLPGLADVGGPFLSCWRQGLPSVPEQMVIWGEGLSGVPHLFWTPTPP